MMDKISFIKQSLECHRRGWISLLPIVGLILAPINLVRCLRIQQEVGSAWNPAAKYLRRGLWLAALALVYHALLVIWITAVAPDFADACRTSPGGR
jgi:hypothetical protein